MININIEQICLILRNILKVEFGERVRELVRDFLRWILEYYFFFLEGNIVGLWM